MLVLNIISSNALDPTYIGRRAASEGPTRRGRDDRAHGRRRTISLCIWWGRTL